jgi:riboflavin biosynthesis pyrimidine reductase
MQKPYIICHMMMSVDGRIDCAMTEKIPGVDEYYKTLDALNASSTLSGRMTAEYEMSEDGTFTPFNNLSYGKVGFAKNRNADAYEIITDTKGKLLWKNQENEDKPLLVITSEQVTKNYLDYLNAQKISWIACGEEKIDLTQAMDLLAREFGVKRLAIVGGGHINGAFLNEGLLDEVSLLLGPAIDGREAMTAVFDGVPYTHEPFILSVKDVKIFEDGALWMRYEVEK